MSPGMMVRPRTSMTSASFGHESAPRAPAAATRSPSRTTAASATGAAPVPSISVAPVNTRIIAQPSWTSRPSSTPPCVRGILLRAPRLLRLRRVWRDCSRSLDLSQEALLLIVGQKAGDEGIARERSHFRFLQPESGGGREIVVDDVSAEVGRIVGVDGGHDSSLQQRAQRMILHRAENPQLHIRQRTNRERNAPGG